jgi:hypothetical protein
MLPTKFHFIWRVSEEKIKMWKVNGRQARWANKKVDIYFSMESMFLEQPSSTLKAKQFKNQG